MLRKCLCAVVDVWRRYFNRYKSGYLLETRPVEVQTPVTIAYKGMRYRPDEFLKSG